MNVSIKAEKEINTLISLRKEFAFLKQKELKHHSSIKWNRGNNHSYDIQIMTIGKTGYGKSTLLNALIGEELFETSNHAICTKSLQSCEYKLSERNHYFSIIDLPGIGENEQKDQEYLKWYNEMIDKSELILYMLRVDQRDYTHDLAAFQKLSLAKRNVLIILNQVDKIEPINRQAPFELSEKQKDNLALKIEEIHRIFSVNRESIIPVSAKEEHNMDLLSQQCAERIKKSNMFVI